MVAVGKRLVFQGTLIFCGQKEGELWIYTGHWTSMQTTGEHIGTLQVVSFLVFCVLGRKKHIMHPQNSNTIFSTSACAVMLSAQKWHHLVVGHIPIYILSKFEVNQTNSSWDTAIFVSSPCFSWSDSLRLKHGLRISNFISIYACHTCPLSSPCQCATSHIQLECGWPDVRVFPVQVPAWDLVQASQNQAWGIPWLSALHPGYGRLCSYGSCWIKATNEIQRNSSITLWAP